MKRYIKIVESSKKHEKATETGDYKTANKNYYLIDDAINFLKENKETEELQKLLAHNEVSVKVWIASYLLKDGNQEAVAVLQEIESKAIRRHSFAAKILLQEWNRNKKN